MKRRHIALFLIMFLLAFNKSAYASEFFNVGMDGNNLKVRQVSVLLDGNRLDSEVPSFIVGNRTLVPIRFIAEDFGAMVNWEEKTKTVTVVDGPTVVILTVDSNKVLVNGVERILDEYSIPKLVTYNIDGKPDARTMVPVRFISEVLGYEVGWDPENYTAKINTSTVVNITNIRTVYDSNGNHQIAIDSDQKLNYEVSYDSINKKYNIEFINAKLNISGNNQTTFENEVGGTFIQRIFSQQTSLPPNPYKVSLSIVMNDEGKEIFNTTSDERSLIVSFEPNKPVPTINNITNISLGFIDGKEAVVLKGVKGNDYKSFILDNPTRYVLDLKDTTLLGNLYQTFDYKLGFINSVRVSQFTPDENYDPNDKIVRVVLDINSGVSPKVNIVFKDDEIYLVPENTLFNYIDYNAHSSSFDFSIPSMALNSVITDYVEPKNQLILSFDNGLIDIPIGKYNINDNFISTIEIEKTLNTTIITMNLNKKISYNLDTNSSFFKINVKSEDTIPTNPSGKTIVIDAGHGGKDPGALSILGFKEKDINLSIALKLENALRQKGYNVIMTRNNDTYVDLYERPKIANQVKADLFISIHCNSTLLSSVNGLEILYCPATESQYKTVDQYPLAKSIHDSIISSTGINSRGIKKRSDLAVLRLTEMPAVLIETAFLSNADDSQKLIQDSFQEKVVQGIVNGVEQYINQY
ncbi:AMIN domain-containing protein [Soehngenia longivitae]|uniref:AMIN domain-containing protein n=2 Tax=Soehngenia longivitae TaxID=2562294 RepID=A0A4Z0DA53_9FIRM|nr:N-acetylmuramoyl-L-alanine amidase family protein [Soehngenia longivitae]TFZ41779.1 AMIN domain-containing protein [Soehngenia longivitae]